MLKLAAGFYVRMGLDPNDESMLTMVVWMPVGRWMGFVFGSSDMAAGNDMIVLNSEALTVLDKHSAGY